MALSDGKGGKVMKKTMSPLLPYPFCGGEVQAKPFAVPGITGVLCDSCGAVVSFRESPDNPATCWNRRVVGGSH